MSPVAEEPKRKNAELNDVRELANATWKLATVVEERMPRDEDVAMTTSTGSGTAGVKGVEKLDRMRRDFDKDPETKYKHVRDKVKSIMRSAPVQSMEAYMEHNTNITRDQLSMHVTTLPCEMLRAGEMEDAARVRGLACGGLQMMEQYCKNGNLELGWMYTLLPDPPMLHKNKEKPIVSMPVQPAAKRRAGRKAFASLVETEVMHTALAALKNYDDLEKLQASTQSFPHPRRALRPGVRLRAGRPRPDRRNRDVSGPRWLSGSPP